MSNEFFSSPENDIPMPDVRVSTEANLLTAEGAKQPLTTLFEYSSDDPYQVTTVFMASDGEVRWNFGRDVLKDGMFEPSGEGDVHTWPEVDEAGRASVMIELNSPSGSALVEVPARDVFTFASQAEQVVPAGKESTHINVDRTIAAIFANDRQ
jgi:hypothetical protein